MRISSDYRDLFVILNKHKVRYLIVGAYAVIYYTEPRFTKDLDIWVEPEPKNADKIYKAIKKFGAPLKFMKSQDFKNKNLIFQIGVAPIRIDIIMGIGDLKFSQAWEKRSVSKYDNVVINILGMKELIKSKQKAGRDQDILDLKKLKAVFKKDLGLRT